MPHRITMHDIMTNNLDDLFTGEKADILYSDPPWGEGNLKYWRTFNGQKGHPVNWIEFIKRVKYLCDRHVTGSCFIETGVKFEKDIITIFGEPQGRYEIIYSNKNLPNILLGWGEQPKLSPHGKKGFDVPFTVISSLPTKPRSVFDCCIGLGMTAKVAKKLGIICYANELNPKRAERTMKILDFSLIAKD